jgi:hypothetical protein
LGGVNHAQEELNQYRIQFGKFTGKTIKQVGLHECTKYLDWILAAAKEKNQPLTQPAKKFQEMVNLAQGMTQ